MTLWQIIVALLSIFFSGDASKKSAAVLVDYWFECKTEIITWYDKVW